MENSVTALDFTPVELVSATGDALRGLRAAASAVRAMLHGGADGSSNISVLVRYDDAVRSELAQVTSRLSCGTRRGDALGLGRLSVVREVFGVMSDAYWNVVGPRLADASDVLRFRTARCLADLVQWSLCDRRAPPETVWVRLGTLFSMEAAGFSGSMAGDRPDIVREYLRAVALIAGELDRLSLPAALALCDVLQASLPFLSLGRVAAEGVHYVVDPLHGPIPTRVLRSEARGGVWCFQPAAVADFLDELALLLSLGRIPRGLEGREPQQLLSVAQHLKAIWCVAPPTRVARRHSVTGALAVVNGFSRACQVLSSRTAVAPATWRMSNLSRNGIGALIAFEEGQAVPDNGELLGLRPVDSVRWHLGVVRRARYARGGVTVGIETLCLRPELIRVDSGEEKLDVVACDSICSGGVVRLVIPSGLQVANKSLFARVNGGMQKLHPLADGSRECDFDLRSYRVS